MEASTWIEGNCQLVLAFINECWSLSGLKYSLGLIWCCGWDPSMAWVSPTWGACWSLNLLLRYSSCFSNVSENSCSKWSQPIDQSQWLACIRIVFGIWFNKAAVEINGAMYVHNHPIVATQLHACRTISGKECMHRWGEIDVLKTRQLSMLSCNSSSSNETENSHRHILWSIIFQFSW